MKRMYKQDFPYINRKETFIYVIISYFMWKLYKPTLKDKFLSGEIAKNWPTESTKLNLFTFIAIRAKASQHILFHSAFQPSIEPP